MLNEFCKRNNRGRTIIKTCPTVQLVAAYNSAAEFCIRPESYIYLNFSVNFRKPVKLLNHIVGTAQLTGHCIDLLLKRANVHGAQNHNFGTGHAIAQAACIACKIAISIDFYFQAITLCNKLGNAFPVGSFCGTIAYIYLCDQVLQPRNAAVQLRNQLCGILFGVSSLLNL